MATSTISVSLKLLIDSNAGRVLFAEDGKDYIDFLLTLLSLPVGTAVRLLSSSAMVGTLGKLYESFQNLSDTYIQPHVNKDTILNPNSATVGLAPEPSTVRDSKRVFMPSIPHKPFSLATKERLRLRSRTLRLRRRRLRRIALIDKGLVRGGVVTYMIMDDLEVKPMSTISSIAMLNEIGVKDVGALEERTVSLGINEGLSLLKASLQTKTVLTSVFLGK